MWVIITLTDLSYFTYFCTFYAAIIRANWEACFDYSELSPGISGIIPILNFHNDPSHPKLVSILNYCDDPKLVPILKYRNDPKLVPIPNYRNDPKLVPILNYRNDPKLVPILNYSNDPN